MASKEQIQNALNELWEKYGNTLSMLSDALDKIETQQSRINQLESELDVEPDIDLNLSTPAAIEQLEKTVLNRHEEK
jgi:phage-related protein